MILWLTLGWRAGAAELLAEIVIGLLLLGGGRGKRTPRALRVLLTRRLRLRAPAPQTP